MAAAAAAAVAEAVAAEAAVEAAEVAAAAEEAAVVEAEAVVAAAAAVAEAVACRLNLRVGRTAGWWPAQLQCLHACERGRGAVAATGSDDRVPDQRGGREGALRVQRRLARPACWRPGRS